MHCGSVVSEIPAVVLAKPVEDRLVSSKRYSMTQRGEDLKISFNKSQDGRHA